MTDAEQYAALAVLEVADESLPSINRQGGPGLAGGGLRALPVLLLSGPAAIPRRVAVNGSNRPHSGPPTLPTWTRSLLGTIIEVEPCAGTTMNVAQWLNAIDLGQYEALFREHEIDAGVLRDLVEADLEKIGVPLGHRKRLMRAIAALSAGETPPSAAKPASAQPSPSAPTSGAEAERRHLTVLFFDLVGSTGLVAKLDPEDWRNLVNAYLDEASKAVTGFGGHVLKRLGDGLMALFGYSAQACRRTTPSAAPFGRGARDPAGACRTQRQERGQGRAPPELKARIGIESGPVVVEANGEVFGDAPNVAARVEAAAEPGSVLVTLNVQRQVAGLFVAEEQGARELKGVSALVQLFRIVRASGGGRRGGARSLTPLVGREEELALLRRPLEAGGERRRAVHPECRRTRHRPSRVWWRSFARRSPVRRHTPLSNLSSSQLLQNTPFASDRRMGSPALWRG